MEKGFIRGFIYIWISGDNMKRQIPVVKVLVEKTARVERVKDAVRSCTSTSRLVSRPRVD